MKKFVPVLLICVMTLSLFGACSSNYTTAGIFGTFLELSLKGRGSNKAKKECLEELERLDAIFSLTNSESTITKVNALAVGDSMTVEEDFSLLFSIAKTVYDYTDGAFNPTLLPVSELWGFAPYSTSKQVADHAAVTALVKTCKMTVFSMDTSTNTITKVADGKLDFGGIAKGYALNRLRVIIEDIGVSGIINLGGNIWATDESNIAVTSPRATAQYNGIVTISNTAISTSGDYERYFIDDSNYRFHHILGSDGYPADNGIQSVSVICNDAAIGDALSTAIFVAGMDKAQDIAAHFGATAIVLTENEVAIYGNTSMSYKIVDSSYSKKFLG